MRVERARVAYIVGLLAPFRQLHLYYVLVPPVEHDAHVSVLAEKRRTKALCIIVNRLSRSSVVVRGS